MLDKENSNLISKPEIFPSQTTTIKKHEPNLFIKWLYVITFWLWFILIWIWFVLFFISLSSVTFRDLTDSTSSKIGVQIFDSNDVITFIVLAIVFLIIISFQMYVYRKKYLTCDVFKVMGSIKQEYKEKKIKNKN